MKVGVVGAGRMGRWFARHSKGLGHIVTLYDIDRGKARRGANELGCSYSESLDGLGSDVVLVAVPIERTLEVIRELYARGMRQIVEISSLKSRLHKGLISLVKKGGTIASIHPLFGEGAGELKKERVVLVPVLDLEEELNLVKDVMGDAKYKVISAEEHDKAMAFVLGLTHLLNMLFSSLVDGKEEWLKDFSSRIFSTQLTLSKAVMLESPDLFVRLQMDNPKFPELLEKLEREFDRVKGFIERGDYKGYMSAFKELREWTEGKEEAYEFIYEFSSNL